MSRPSVKIGQLTLAPVLVLLLAAAVKSADNAPALRFENHQFAPQTLTVPVGQPLSLKVTNASADPIEFESFALHREKVIEPGQTITVPLPSLKAGSYDFYDDFHQEVPEGRIVAQ